jgi:adenylosuccinate synthase
MKTAQVVIGANYGDEGKGKMVDYFCSQYDPQETLVVRYNGGAQAGHTVVTPDGQRHVFHHFGSGTLYGAATYLGKDFIVNPVIFIEELKKLWKFGVKPKIRIDSKCRVTTPYEMLLNQLLERGRGKDRHGSCGLGIFETIRRPLSITVNDLTQASLTTFKAHLRDCGLLAMDRLFEEGLLTEENKKLFEIDCFDHFYLDWKSMMSCTTKDIPSEHVIFEGAQGLMLNEKYGVAPYLTPSDTGVAPVVELTKGMDKVEVCYVTRPYITRHGAGPLPHEYESMIEDNTNVRNEFQGALRFGRIDYDTLADRIHKDFSQIKNGELSVAVNCLDHVGSYIRVDAIKFAIQDMKTVYTSNGPTRNDVRRENCTTNSLIQ